MQRIRWLTIWDAGAAAACNTCQAVLQRQHRLPSTTLIFDLQFKLRCLHCRALKDFEITIIDMRNMRDNSKPCPQRVIVPRGA